MNRYTGSVVGEVRLAFIICLLVALSLIVFPALVVQAKTIYVNDDPPTTVNDGTSWDTAYTDLQFALQIASSVNHDEIWVAKGTYKPGTVQTASFQLINGVALYGGFAGGETSVSQRDWESNKTILSGDLDGDDGENWEYRDDNSYHVVTGSGTDATAVLDGFTVSGGYADEVAFCRYGGGMLNKDGSPTVTHCTFSDNYTWRMGGGMYNDGSNPTVTECAFSGNWANDHGGGMANYGSSPELTNCTFSNNDAGLGGGMANVGSNANASVTHCTFSGNFALNGGGGMYNYNCSPDLTDCTFSGNTAGGSPMSAEGEGHGGAMYNYDSSPELTDCTFSGNTAGGSMTVGGHGGGMCNEEGSSPTVANCTFSANEAHYGGGMSNFLNSNPTVTDCTFSANEAYCGGGMDNFDSSLTWADAARVENCTFSDNVADERGGGMCNRCSVTSHYIRPRVTNCTFSANEAYYGGGMDNGLGGRPWVTNCTFLGNSAVDGGGGGMWNSDVFTIYKPSVKNTILAGNDPDDCLGSVDSGGYNLESGTSCGCTKTTDQQNADPLLAPLLQDNGGPTLTHALLPGSPAIDVIPPADNYNGAPSTDQRGVPRPQPALGCCDIGAVEMEQSYGRGDVNGDGRIDLMDVRLFTQIAQGIITGTAAQRAAGDIDGDGDVDMDDVTILSEYVLGIRTTLP